MSEHDKERLDRLEMKLTDLLIKVDQHEVLLQQLTARISRQDQLLSRLLNLLGLMLPELEAEDAPRKAPFAPSADAPDDKLITQTPSHNRSGDPTI